MIARKLTPLLFAMLVGCGTSPPVQLYQLRADPAALGPLPAATVSPTWALGPVVLPDYLDRDAIVRTSGQASLVSNPGERWAESLRDAVPRLLQQDLARLRGSDSVWRMPMPPGVMAERQLRVEIQRLDADSAGRSVVLQARWTLIDPSGASKPVVAERRIEVSVAAADTDSLVSAHRTALWQLAQAIAAAR